MEKLLQNYINLIPNQPQIYWRHFDWKTKNQIEAYGESRTAENIQKN